MYPKKPAKAVMSTEDKTRLASIYTSNGHIYVTNQGYVHLHFYLKQEDEIDFIVRKLKANKEKHRQVYDVKITKRLPLAKACIILQDVPLSSEQMQELSLVHNYATSKNRTERYGIARKLRGKGFTQEVEDRLAER